MICPNCGAINRVSARFCRVCGTDLNAVPASANNTAQNAPQEDQEQDANLVTTQNLIALAAAPETTDQAAADEAPAEAGYSPLAMAPDQEVTPGPVTLNGYAEAHDEDADTTANLPEMPSSTAPLTSPDLTADQQAPDMANAAPDMDQPRPEPDTTEASEDAAPAPVVAAQVASEPETGAPVIGATPEYTFEDNEQTTPLATGNLVASDVAPEVTPLGIIREAPEPDTAPAAVLADEEQDAAPVVVSSPVDYDDLDLPPVIVEDSAAPLAPAVDTASVDQQDSISGGDDSAVASTTAEIEAANVTTDDLTAPLAAPNDVIQLPATEADDTMAGNQRETRHLDETETPEVAPTAPGDPFPALAKGDLVADRYMIEQVLQTGPQRQTYLASDEKGYVRCWACGSTANTPGEIYCNDCGAQLSGRSYRLYEAPASAQPTELPPALFDASIPAVAQVIAALTDEKSGRHYVVVDETSGRPLSEFVGEASGDTPSRPSPERVLNWITQAADLLAQLHKAGATSCDFSPESLRVLPDERVVLSDPVSCRVTPPTQKDDYQADTQRVAASLEQLYFGLNGLPMEMTPAYSAGSGKPEDLAAVLRAGSAGTYKTATEFSSALRDLFDVLVPPRDLQLVSGRATDVGVQRSLNEDSLLVLEFLAMEAAGSLPVGIYIVADGMGGHQSGEVASSIAIRTVGSLLQQRVLAGQVTGEDHLPDPDRSKAVVREAVLEANRRIVDLARQRKSDMGTTITMALVIGNQATVANVGDSRTYLWRDNRLQQISRDHSLVARLVAAGQLSPEESRYFERRNEIYLALGDPKLTADQVDVFQRTLRPNDGLLLCSDGEWEMAPDVQIEQTLVAAKDISAGAQDLINLANKNGGEDNISVILVQAVINKQTEAVKHQGA